MPIEVKINITEGPGGSVAVAFDVVEDGTTAKEIRVNDVVAKAVRAALIEEGTRGYEETAKNTKAIEDENVDEDEPK